MTANHYDTLGISETATQPEIKQAYRRLAKQYHPDSQQVEASHEAISQVNVAYEVLSDPQTRRQYDQQRQYLSQVAAAGIETDRRTRYERTVDIQNHYRQRRQAGQTADDQFQQWMRQVYSPIDRLIGKIMSPLKSEVRALSADPFDDELMENFQGYLETCRESLDKAQQTFKSMPNPAKVASVAANLYYCMNQLEDGIEEMERFTYNYDDSYLHTGQELFRISAQLRREAKTGVKEMG
ncbi:MAG: J domain-containing protein [Leptolyngbya sp. SIO4C1]|nr:J domain-containing protein [Leptolyngbya sp. SIO4C1]